MPTIHELFTIPHIPVVCITTAPKKKKKFTISLYAAAKLNEIQQNM
jgi:hypothetical protein